MGTKRTPRLMADAKRMRAEGRSFAEVAAALSKGGKTVSKAAVLNWLRDSAPSSAPAVEPPAPPAAAPVAAPESPDDAAPDDIGPDELRALYAGEIRRHQAEADRATADGRPGDARQSSRLVVAFSGQLQRIHARADEDVETVRVRASDMASAGERALAGLAAVADRVASERAGWPRCSGCGQPVGAFAASEVSAVRAMFERVCRG